MMTVDQLYWALKSLRSEHGNKEVIVDCPMIAQAMYCDEVAVGEGEDDKEYVYIFTTPEDPE